MLTGPDEHMPYIIQLHIMSMQRETDRQTERQRQRETEKEKDRDRDRGLCFEQHCSAYLQGGRTPCPGRPAHHPMEEEGVAGRKYAWCRSQGGWVIRDLGLIRSRHVTGCCVPKEIGRNVVCVIV